MQKRGRKKGGNRRQLCRITGWRIFGCGVEKWKGNGGWGRFCVEEREEKRRQQETIMQDYGMEDIRLRSGERQAE